MGLPKRTVIVCKNGRPMVAPTTENIKIYCRVDSRIDRKRTDFCLQKPTGRGGVSPPAFAAKLLFSKVPPQKSTLYIDNSIFLWYNNLKHNEKEEYANLLRTERGRLVQVLGKGCGSSFGVVSGKGSAFFASCVVGNGFRRYGILSVQSTSFYVHAKSGGTACFHVLMLDGGAFSFVKK